MLAKGFPEVVVMTPVTVTLVAVGAGMKSSFSQDETARAIVRDMINVLNENDLVILI